MINFNLLPQSRTPSAAPAFRMTKECPLAEGELLPYILKNKGDVSLKDFVRKLIVDGWIERDPDAEEFSIELILADKEGKKW